MTKIRPGGVLTAEFEQRVRDGDTMALRALVAQASTFNVLDMPVKEFEVTSAPDGTGGTRLTFTGYAAVVDHTFTHGDAWGDYQFTLKSGCFNKTLPKTGQQPDTIFCLNHDHDAVPMARTKAGTMQLSQDSRGLINVAKLDGSRADVYAVQSAVDAGELDAQSFAFKITQQQWSDDFTKRDVYEVDLNGPNTDTSVVTWPANPATTGSVGLLRAKASAMLRTGVPALVVETAHTERLAGRALSANTMTALQAVLGLIADADTALDQAQPLLAALMGVPDPDANDTEEQSITETPDPAATRLARVRDERQAREKQYRIPA